MSENKWNDWLQSPVVGKALQDQESRGGIIGAVCAGK